MGKIGRPSKPESFHRTKIMNIRMGEEEIEQIKKLAKQQHQSISAVVRAILNKEIARYKRLAHSGQPMPNLGNRYYQPQEINPD